MRIYSNPLEAVREVERDLFEMGIRVHPQTMQDKQIANDPNYETIELQGFGYKIMGWGWLSTAEEIVVQYVLTGEQLKVISSPEIRAATAYIDQEHKDRWSGQAMNPGRAWLERREVWSEFLHDGRFAYTYSERFAPQLPKILRELEVHPDTRQAIINIHSNICPLTKLDNPVSSMDLHNTGGAGRIPCSMYYQFMRRNNALDLIYTMRSCDFLVHYPIDLMLALRAQTHVAQILGIKPGAFTHFIGSLHAYQKDMNKRGIF